MPRKRSRFETINVILALARDGIRKTHIMYRANLSHQLLEKYLTLLLDKQLLQHKDGHYYTTEKGHAFITAFHEIQLILNEGTTQLF